MTIFITVKGESKRCPNKNKVLLPYVLNQISSSFSNIIVITDSLELKEIADNFGVVVYLENKEIQKGEFFSIYDFLMKTNTLLDIPEFILLPATQPFRSIELIQDIISCDLEGYDFATSYSKVPNRKIFLLNNDFSYKYESYERKGSLCSEEKMIDGYIYKIKTSFLKNIVNSDNSNNYFWNHSRIKFIENKSRFFLDIDEPEDLDLFIKLQKIELRI